MTESTSYPAAHEYLSRFVREKWEIQSLVILDSDITTDTIKHERFGAPILYCAPRDENKQINWMVGRIKNHFGWA